MSGRVKKTVGGICFGICFLFGSAMVSRAAEYPVEIGKETSTYLVAQIDARETAVYQISDIDSAVKEEAKRGDTYQVVSDQNGWLEVRLNKDDEETGYIRKNDVSVVEAAVEVVDEETVRRRDLVDYALQFVGGRYVYGGSDPNTGVDCSGFTRYVMKYGAGVELNRSSGSQAGQGREIDSDQMRPGDLIFYGNRSRINHVGMYIGNGQIVHASTEKTGIKTSVWNYRKPVKIVSVINE